MDGTEVEQYFLDGQIEVALPRQAELFHIVLEFRMLCFRRKHPFNSASLVAPYAANATGR
jgi:hypothetical protein